MQTQFYLKSHSQCESANSLQAMERPFTTFFFRSPLCLFVCFPHQHPARTNLNWQNPSLKSKKEHLSQHTSCQINPSWTSTNSNFPLTRQKVFVITNWVSQILRHDNKILNHPPTPTPENKGKRNVRNWWAEELADNENSRFLLA